jgi:hypothetical protein
MCIALEFEVLICSFLRMVVLECGIMRQAIVFNLYPYHLERMTNQFMFPASAAAL